MPESEMMSGDLEVNNLTYKQPTSLSLATNRKMCRQFFQRNNYRAGDTAICEFNSGSSYVNGHNSYLTFKVKTIGAVGALASGSAINFLESLTIRWRSGTELDRIDHLNLWAKNNIPWSYSNDWINHFGSMVGLTNTVAPSLDGKTVITTDERFTAYLGGPGAPIFQLVLHPYLSLQPRLGPVPETQNVLDYSGEISRYNTGEAPGVKQQALKTGLKYG